MHVYSEYNDPVGLDNKNNYLQRSGQSSELVYSVGEGSNRWGNTEDRMSITVKSPATTKNQDSPQRT